MFPFRYGTVRHHYGRVTRSDLIVASMKIRARESKISAESVV